MLVSMAESSELPQRPTLTRAVVSNSPHLACSSVGEESYGIREDSHGLVRSLRFSRRSHMFSGPTQNKGRNGQC